MKSQYKKLISQKKIGDLSNFTHEWYKIGKSQKKTKKPKENQSPIHMPTTIGGTII